MRTGWLKITCSVAALAVAGVGRGDGPRDPAAEPALAKLGWRLSVQAWTFNEFTFAEACTKVRALGVRHIEPFPGQKLKPGSDAEVGPDMAPADLAEMRRLMAEAGLTPLDFGVVELNEDEAWNRKVFEFGKALGLENIVAEPPEAALPAIDMLCAEYGLNVAFHNHPKPSHYWNPATEQAAFRGRSLRIGSCCDTGHWMRSGIDPLRALRGMEGRIRAMHFKDLNAFGDPGAHDVPWGTGKGRSAALLAELKRQGAKPVISVEYETGGPDLMENVAQCIAFLDRTAIALAGDTAPKP